MTKKLPLVETLKPLSPSEKIFSYLAEGINLSPRDIREGKIVSMNTSKYDTRYKVEVGEVIYSFTEKKLKSGITRYRVSAVHKERMKERRRPNKVVIAIDTDWDASSKFSEDNYSDVTVSLEYGVFIDGTRKYPYRYIFQENIGYPESIMFIPGTLRQDLLGAEERYEKRLSRLPNCVASLNKAKEGRLIKQAFYIVKKMANNF